MQIFRKLPRVKWNCQSVSSKRYNESIICLSFIYGLMNFLKNLANNRLINSMAPGRYGNNFKGVNLKLIIHNGSLGTHCEIALRWMQKPSLTRNQHWFRKWLGAVRGKHAIAWPNVDCRLYLAGSFIVFWQTVLLVSEGNFFMYMISLSDPAFAVCLPYISM